MRPGSLTLPQIPEQASALVSLNEASQAPSGEASMDEALGPMTPMGAEGASQAQAQQLAPSVAIVPSIGSEGASQAQAQQLVPSDATVPSISAERADSAEGSLETAVEPIDAVGIGAEGHAILTATAQTLPAIILGPEPAEPVGLPVHGPAMTQVLDSDSDGGSLFQDGVDEAASAHGAPIDKGHVAVHSDESHVEPVEAAERPEPPKAVKLAKKTKGSGSEVSWSAFREASAASLHVHSDESHVEPVEAAERPEPPKVKPTLKPAKKTKQSAVIKAKAKGSAKRQRTSFNFGLCDLWFFRFAKEMS